MATKPIDTFILNSVDLFKVNPSQSVISITYQPPKVTVSSSSSSSQKKKTNLPSITFKTNNPHLASTYKYRTNKNKDVSRILNSIGPNGVSIIPNGILKRQINSKSNNQKNNKKKKIALITGLSTLLINNKIPQFIENNNNNNTTTTTTSTTTNKDSKKKKNKNKNKNKR